MNKKVQAKNLMKQLESDPEWVAARDSEERHRHAWAEVMRRNERPIIEELRSVGFNVESVGGLYQKHSSTDIGGVDQDISLALPILMKHFGLPYHFNVRSLIASSLLHDWAFPALSMLVDKLKQTRFSAADEIAFAISLVQSDMEPHFSLEQIEYLTNNQWASYCFRLANTVCYLSKHGDIPLLLEIIDDDRYLDEVRIGIYDLLVDKLKKEWKSPLPADMKRLKNDLVPVRKRLATAKPSPPE